MFLDDEFTIPNALYILFGPLYSFRDQLDVLTVSTSYKSTLADVYAIGNKARITTAPSSTIAPGISTLSITFAPGLTLAPVKTTELVTSPSITQPWVM